MRRIVGYLFLLILLPPSEVHAWWSMPINDYSTHYRISSKAIDWVSKSEYPDISKFGEILVTATSGPTDDANAHGRIKDSDVNQIGADNAGEFDGGDFVSWWKYSRIKYEKSNFAATDYNAYYYIGLMAHLVEDQAVPAHAANIYHAKVFDGLEKYTGGNNFWPNAIYAKDFGNDPQVYYYSANDTDNNGVLRATQNKLISWVSTSNNGRVFWAENKNFKYIGQPLWPTLYCLV